MRIQAWFAHSSCEWRVANGGNDFLGTEFCEKKFAKNPKEFIDWRWFSVDAASDINSASMQFPNYPESDGHSAGSRDLGVNSMNLWCPPTSFSRIFEKDSHPWLEASEKKKPKNPQKCKKSKSTSMQMDAKVNLAKSRNKISIHLITYNWKKLFRWWCRTTGYLL